MAQPEHSMQCALVRYITLQHPGTLYCGSPGGIRATRLQGGLMKAAGYRKGFPDLMVYEPRGQYIGLAMELKTKTGTTSKEQKEWLKALEERGWKACIIKSLEAGIITLDSYMKL